RGENWPEQPASGRFRIAVIGDSFVESSGLPEDLSFTRMIEKHLGGCPALGSNRAEVLNLGVSGYGTAQQYLLLHRAIDFRPNLVLLVFYAGNDIADNSRILSIESQKERPYFIEQPTGALHLDTSFPGRDAFRQALSSDWWKRLVNARSTFSRSSTRARFAGARAHSSAAPIANREQQKSTAEGRKGGQLFSVEREGGRVFWEGP